MSKPRPADEGHYIRVCRDCAHPRAFHGNYGMSSNTGWCTACDGFRYFKQADPAEATAYLMGGSPAVEAMRRTK